MELIKPIRRFRYPIESYPRYEDTPFSRFLRTTVVAKGRRDGQGTHRLDLVACPRGETRYLRVVQFDDYDVVMLVTQSLRSIERKDLFRVPQPLSLHV